MEWIVLYFKTARNMTLPISRGSCGGRMRFEQVSFRIQRASPPPPNSEHPRNKMPAADHLEQAQRLPLRCTFNLKRLLPIQPLHHQRAARAAVVAAKRICGNRPYKYAPVSLYLLLDMANLSFFFRRLWQRVLAERQRRNARRSEKLDVRSKNRNVLYGHYIVWDWRTLYGNYV